MATAAKKPETVWRNGSLNLCVSEKPRETQMPTPTLTTLVSFNGTNGSAPENFLVADTAGDLFGTTGEDGPGGGGTVFEIARTSTGYASTPTTLMSVSSSSEPSGYLLIRASLFLSHQPIEKTRINT
jgi:hypothetical protein